MGYDSEMGGRTGFTRRSGLKGSGVVALAALAGRALQSGAGAQDATPGAEAIPTLAFTAKDYEFLELPASIPGGYTRLSMLQEGPADHHAMFMRLNEGVTADDFMAALQTGDFGAILGAAVSMGGPNAGGIGSITNVVVDLTPGQYVVVCLIPDEDSGMPHAAMGMISALEVTTSTTDAQLAPPEIQGTIDLVDFSFEGLPAELPAGPHTWAITDSGDQLHEMVIYQQAPGVPYSVIESIFLAPPEATPTVIEATPEAMASPEASGPPPFTAIGGVAPMNPGVINYLEIELAAGDHFAICFIPDAETGAPHFALGMIMPFTVV